LDHDTTNLLGASPINSAYDFYAKDILKQCGEADFNIVDFSLTLADRLGPYHQILWRKGQEFHFNAVFQGFLSSLPRKNIRNIAIAHTSDGDAQGIGACRHRPKSMMMA
jgi:hypothetical protein